MTATVRALSPERGRTASAPTADIWLLLLNGNRAAPVYVVPGTNRALFGAQKSKYHQSTEVDTLSEIALL